MASTAAKPVAPLTSLVGQKVRVRVATGAEFEADVFAYDAAQKVFAFRQPARHTFQKAEYHLVPAAAVAGYEHLGAGEIVSDLRLPTDEEVARRVHEAYARERERVSRIGIGVTPEAQFIFDSIAKTIPCRWDKQNMVITDAVVVLPPYRADDSCVVIAKGVDATHYADTRERIKMVINKAWDRIKDGALAEGVGSPGSPPGYGRSPSV